MNDEKIFYRLNRIDQVNSEIIDEILDDDYVPRPSDYLKEGKVIGSSRLFINEIEEAFLNKNVDEIGQALLVEVLDSRIKKKIEECKYKSKIFGQKNVRNYDYLESIVEIGTNSKINVDELSLKDFLQFRKEHTKEQDESLADFKLKISNSEFDLFEKIQPDRFIAERSEITSNYAPNRQLAEYMQSQTREEKNFTSKNILYKSSSLSSSQNQERGNGYASNNASNVFTSKPNPAPSLPSKINYEPRLTKCYKRRNEDEQINKADYENVDMSTIPFKSAREQLMINDAKNGQKPSTELNNQAAKRPMITSNHTNNNAVANNAPAKRGIHTKFNLPIRSNEEEKNNNKQQNSCGNLQAAELSALKNIDQKLIDIITSEVLDKTTPITWDHICGLEFQKQTILEIVIWPMIRPDLFFGLTAPAKGLLLFGPPGTGKTLFAKCIAHESKSTFFNISASTLTSKWQGESEKLVKVLYEVARAYAPSVIFIDEIDSLLAKRSDDDREGSRRLKTEFFVQMDGCGSDENERVLTIGATNRPQELDDAARRRFVKKLFIPLPEKSGRKEIIQKLMLKASNNVTDEEIDEIAEMTDGYSGADMHNLCRESALGPIRNLRMCPISSVSADQVRPINFQDFVNAMNQVKASVSKSDLDAYFEWDKSFGSNSSK